jgi:hypothetical protein
MDIAALAMMSTSAALWTMKGSQTGRPSISLGMVCPVVLSSFWKAANCPTSHCLCGWMT